MNPTTSVGRLLTLEEALAYFTKVVEAEKVMGPLTREEKLMILAQQGTDVTHDDLMTLLQDKRTLVVKGKEAN